LPEVTLALYRLYTKPELQLVRPSNSLLQQGTESELHSSLLALPNARLDYFRASQRVRKARLRGHSSA
jgi:hypothetical protein